MTDALTTAVIAGASAIIGGFLNGAYQHIRDRFTEPKLAIDFLSTAANIDSADYKDADKHVSEIYIRVRIRNTGRQVARSCRVFIAGLNEIHPSGTIATNLYDAKQIAWAGYDFLPLDVPQGVDFYADVVRVSKSEPGWKFSVQKLFASQTSLRGYRGTYRFRLLVTAENAHPAECEVDIAYDGDWHNLRAMQLKAH